jgi:hypothetical protein
LIFNAQTFYIIGRERDYIEPTGWKADGTFYATNLSFLVSVPGVLRRTGISIGADNPQNFSSKKIRKMPIKTISYVLTALVRKVKD